MVLDNHGIHLITANNTMVTGQSQVANESNGIDYITSFDYMDNTHSIFYMFESHGIVHRLLNDTSLTVSIVNEIHTAGSIVCDWITNNIYWTDPPLQQIRVGSTDGRHQRVLYSANIEPSFAIVLNPYDG